LALLIPQIEKKDLVLQREKKTVKLWVHKGRFVHYFWGSRATQTSKGEIKQRKRRRKDC